MSVGLSFLRSVLENGGAPTYLLDNSLNRENFSESELVVVDCIERHVSSYGVFPSFEAVVAQCQIEFPQIPNEPVRFWVDRVKERTLALKVADGIQKATRLLQSGNYSALTEHIKAMGSEAVATQEKVAYDTLANLSEKVLQLHDERALKTTYDVADVPFGFPYLDTVSDGIQPGDTVAIVGKEGIGKSYIMCRMAKAAHDAGKVPLFISMEMSNIQIARRLVALRTHINETRLRKGQLSTFIGRRLISEDIVNQSANSVPFYLLDGGLVLKVEDLALYTRMLHPDVIYLDGAYLLKTRAKSDSRWSMVAEAAEAVKILARTSGVPVVGSYQFNKEGGIFGSRTIKQLASIVMSLESTTNDQSFITPTSYRKMTIVKGRFGESGSIRLTYNMVNARIEQDEVLTGFLSPIDIEEDYDDDADDVTESSD